MNNKLEHLINEITKQIEDKYGHRIGILNLAKILGYDSPQTLSQSIYRGTCPIPMKKEDGRRGYVTTARIVAKYLANLEFEITSNE